MDLGYFVKDGTGVSRYGRGSREGRGRKRNVLGDLGAWLQRAAGCRWGEKKCGVPCVPQKLGVPGFRKVMTAAKPTITAVMIPMVLRAA